MTTVTLGQRRVGDQQPVFILAEVASAHQGDPRKAVALARAAQEAGAHGVKFQLFRADELLAPNDPRMDTFRRIELPTEDWKRVLDETRSLGIPILADVFDRASLGLGEAQAITAYKIHSTDMENPDFIREVAATGKPLLLSTGGCRPGDVDQALGAARAEGNDQVVLLHGVQNFPTEIGDSHLRFIATLKSRYGRPVGFLDHVDGGSLMARALPALALTFGADLIEKHITLDRAAKEFDYESALDPGPFSEMVELIHQAERALGSAEMPHSQAAESYHEMMRRAVLSREILRKGEPVRREQMVFLRNEAGLAPRDASRLVGRRPRRDIAAWEPLTEALFE